MSAQAANAAGMVEAASAARTRALAGSRAWGGLAASCRDTCQGQGQSEGKGKGEGLDVCTCSDVVEVLAAAEVSASQRVGRAAEDNGSARNFRFAWADIGPWAEP